MYSTAARARRSPISKSPTTTGKGPSARIYSAPFTGNGTECDLSYRWLRRTTHQATTRYVTPDSYYHALLMLHVSMLVYPARAICTGMLRRPFSNRISEQRCILQAHGQGSHQYPGLLPPTVRMHPEGFSLPSSHTECVVSQINPETVRPVCYP